mgnify:CR=1 FL=1
MSHKSYTLKINSLPTNAKLIPHGIIDKVQELKNHKFNLETIKIKGSLLDRPDRFYIVCKNPDCRHCEMVLR